MDKKQKTHIDATYHIVGKGDQIESTFTENWSEYPKKDIVKNIPLHLDIESTSICNLKCPMCTQSTDELRPDPANMPREFFEYIVDEFSSKIPRREGSIKMQLRGEPLITKDIVERTKYASDRGLRVKFNTNGTLLNEQLSNRLIDAGTYLIMFSIDSHIPEEYNKIRIFGENKPGDFNRVLNNIKNLVKLRAARGTQYPLIEISRVNLPETRESLNEFSRFWLNNGVDLVSILDLNDYSLGKTGNVLVSKEFRCEQPWQRMFILADGITTQCCGDTHQKMPLGQLAMPYQIRSYEKELELRLRDEKPGSAIEMKIYSSPKLEKDVIGIVQKDMTVKAQKIRYKGISGIKKIIPLVDNVEELWRGCISEYIREMNRTGQSDRIDICADCGYRQTVISKKGFDYTTRPKKMKKNEKSIQTRYEKSGLD